MNESSVIEAFRRMFPDEMLNHSVQLRFSRKFNPYNATVRRAGSRLVFSLSPEWENISEEISMGLIQELLLKILRRKAKETVNTGLYSVFIKNLHLSAKKTEADERLKVLFDKVNSTYFSSSIELPNLRWRLNSRRRLATYDYHTDTISVSRIFREADDELVSYLLYHEMLHKKLKFRSGIGRTIHHGRQFRELEMAFENSEAIEKRLKSFVGKRSGFFEAIAGSSFRKFFKENKPI